LTPDPELDAAPPVMSSGLFLLGTTNFFFAGSRGGLMDPL
jgi:hypothetical protein